jgi:NADPH:quinone reductase-like Zn-dependent oxidoreductase
MRSYELQPRDGLDALTPAERPAPGALGPLDVRVRVRACSLNFRDLGMIRVAKKLKAAIVPVSDGAGEVVEVGPGVSRVKVGDRVAASFFPYWVDGDFTPEQHGKLQGGTIDGMLVEEKVLPESAWVQLPRHLSFEEGATLPCAAVTAWHALFEAAKLRPGDTVLAQGTGGVSIFALQLARAAGADVVVTSSSSEKRERVRELGAVHTIDYKQTPQWGDAVRGWSGGRGVDVAVEVGGPGTFDQSVAALRYGGTMSILGVLTGTKGEVNTYQVFHKGIHIHGIYVGSVRMFEAMNRAITAAEIHPVIDRVFGFDEARAAYEYLQSGAHFGKVVIKLG